MSDYEPNRLIDSNHRSDDIDHQSDNINQQEHQIEMSHMDNNIEQNTPNQVPTNENQTPTPFKHKMYHMIFLWLLTIFAFVFPYSYVLMPKITATYQLCGDSTYNQTLGCPTSITNHVILQFHYHNWMYQSEDHTYSCDGISRYDLREIIDKYLLTDLIFNNYNPNECHFYDRAYEQYSILMFLFFSCKIFIFPGIVIFTFGLSIKYLFGCACPTSQNDPHPAVPSLGAHPV